MNASVLRQQNREDCLSLNIEDMKASSAAKEYEKPGADFATLQPSAIGLAVSCPKITNSAVKFIL